MRVKCLSVLFLVCFCNVSENRIRNDRDKKRYHDCEDVFRSGIGYKKSGSYYVYLNSSKPIHVYCDYVTRRTHVAIMQQKYGRESFKRNYHDYVNGFGEGTEFWIGLSIIKNLTDSGYRVLIVTLQDCDYKIKTLRYNNFSLGPANQRYPLHIGGYVSSHVLPDDFSHNDGMPFSTMDRLDIRHCAKNQKGGWWYNSCTFTLPTGHYYDECNYKPSGGFYDGIFYKDWHGYGNSLKYIKMELS